VPGSRDDVIRQIASRFDQCPQCSLKLVIIHVFRPTVGRYHVLLNTLQWVLEAWIPGTLYVQANHGHTTENVCAQCFFITILPDLCFKLRFYTVPEEKSPESLGQAFAVNLSFYIHWLGL